MMQGRFIIEYAEIEESPEKDRHNDDFAIHPLFVLQKEEMAFPDEIEDVENQQAKSDQAILP